MFFESNGDTDVNLSDWTPLEVASAKSAVAAGFQWWSDTLDLEGSVHELNFEFDFTKADAPLETRIESSVRFLDDAMLAIDDFRIDSGYDISGRESFFDRYFDINKFNAELREANQTDWAITVFVFRESFVEGPTASALQGGPWIILAGIDAIQREHFAHEVGHVFHVS